ncbi:common plant regulatory factor 1-like isoform X2 [Mangifera indica]|uniref:common plant regulatory factor 1-like isoform X2 n=1 Tax=Mangifera indica TaxID=29780 RepID=UPI001CFABB5E|nr:common plant regulatory factor 1-like isoform X2 [Mangifera indica]XP_044494517.1 common plant regulatory factor 1-like isoform X2 [Mangifera indica]XP_044494518.1 common plant regulatory factor 1-like isoform X2 [Mangifera indica]
MGNNEDVKSSKSDKSSSPASQGNIPVYPDWAALQAYYGPRVAIQPYYNSAVASGHAPPHYMWSPQPMMPPYGAPYAAIYSPGGVYAHPAVPLASHPHGHGVPSSPAIVVPLSTEAPTKSSGNSERSLMKKLKGFDGLAMSIGNGNNAESANDGAEHRLSQSEAEGSTEGSDGNTSKENQARRKRSREGTPIIGGDGKTETQPNPASGGDANAAPNVLGTSVAGAGVPGKPSGPVLSPGMTTTLELRNPTSMNSKTSPSGVPQPCAVLPTEGWLQNEREIKRERRKQSNRESARRSRLRKQAETEELARKVDSLNVENMTLKSEIDQLTEKSEELRLENATLMEKLKNAHAQEIILNNVDDKRVTPISTENLLSRVNNSGSVDKKVGEEGHLFEKKSNSGAKLRQLLDASPRADAVAAG